MSRREPDPLPAHEGAQLLRQFGRYLLVLTRVARPDVEVTFAVYEGLPGLPVRAAGSAPFTPLPFGAEDHARAFARIVAQRILDQIWIPSEQRCDPDTRVDIVAMVNDIEVRAEALLAAAATDVDLIGPVEVKRAIADVIAGAEQLARAAAPTLTDLTRTEVTNLVRQLLADGHTAATIADGCQVSPRTVRRWAAGTVTAHPANRDRLHALAAPPPAAAPGACPDGCRAGWHHTGTYHHRNGPVQIMLPCGTCNPDGPTPRLPRINCAGCVITRSWAHPTDPAEAATSLGG